jgi:hypothetical protein
VIRRRSDRPPQAAYRQTGKKENKSAKGSRGGLVFFLPGLSSPAKPGGQIVGGSTCLSAYASYVSYVVIFCLRELRAFVVISCGLNGSVIPC